MGWSSTQNNFASALTSILLFQYVEDDDHNDDYDDNDHKNDILS